MKKFLFVVVFILSAGRVHAEGPAPSPKGETPAVSGGVAVNLPQIHAPAQSAKGQIRYSLSELLDEASKRSNWIASFRARVEDSRFEALQAGAWQNPETSFAGGRKKGQPEKGPLWEVAVEQPVYFPGKQSLRTQIGQVATATAGVRLAEAETTVAQAVARLAYQYAVIGRKQAIIADRIKRYELIQSFLAGHILPAPEQQAQRHIVETRLDNLVSDALQIQRDAQSVLAQLRLYVDLPPGALPEIEVPWLKGISHDEGAKSQWLEKAPRGNFKLSSQRLALKGVQKEKELAQLEAFPDFTPTAFYERETAGETERRAGLGLSLPLPVLNRNENGVRSLERRIQAEEHLLRFYERELSSQLEQLWAEYETACLIVQRYPESLLEDLKPRLQTAEEEFRKDRLGLLSFVELDDQISARLFRALDAQTELVDKLLDLLFFAGEKNVLEYLAGQ